MTRPARYAALALATVLAMPAFAQEGQPCEPGESPPREGLICAKAYDEDGLPVIDAHEPIILNAERGDLVLSGGCGGEIGGLFAQLDPPQRYSHEGILTDDLGSHITHTTAGMGRYLSSAAMAVLDPNVPNATEGVAPEILKYGWPGGLIQPVGDAYEGAVIPDPSGTGYLLDSFSSDPFWCPEYAATVPQLVVTFPREFVGTDTGATARAQLGEAASLLEADSYDVEAGTGSYPSHYRWYHYTNGALRELGRAPEDAFQWYSGNIPGASSTSIWSALSRAGVFLEGDALEPGTHDTAFAVELVGDAITPELAADLDPGQSMDGLYLYTEAERRRAGTWMRGQIYDKAMDTMTPGDEAAGGETIYEAATDSANQFVNCMAFDWCGTETPKGSCTDGEGHAKDSECWENPGIGIAAAPEDFLSWDRPNPDDPATSGALGYSEALEYSVAGVVRAYAWGPDEGTGTVTGVLEHAGKPVQGQSILIKTVTGGEITATTCCDGGGQGDPGTFTVVGVPAGPTEVHACYLTLEEDHADHPGPWFAGQVVDVVPTEALGDAEPEPVTLSLAEQACLDSVQVTNKTREVTISGIVEVVEDDTTHEDHNTFTLDEMVLPTQLPLSTILNPFEPPAFPYDRQVKHTFALERCSIDPLAGDPSVPDVSEILMKVTVEVELVDGTGPDIQARVTGQMYEEESCPNSDLDRTWRSGLVTVPAGGEVAIQTPAWQENEEWPDTDRFRFNVTVTNAQAPVPPEFQ